MDELRELIDMVEAQLELAEEQAHRHPVPMEFEGSRTFTKDELNAVWAQGRKDAFRFMLTNLRYYAGHY